MLAPNFSDILYFLEVTRTSNISRAAKNLRISQPSLTQAIHRVENFVDAKLFHRSRSGVTLTSAGRTFLARSQTLIDSWQNVLQGTQSTLHQIQGPVTLGCHPAVALFSVDKFLPDVIKDYPQLQIKIHHGLSRQITDEVINRNVDVGIVVNPIRHPDLVIQKLCTDRVTVWSTSKIKVSEGSSFTLICDPGMLQTQDILRKLQRIKKGNLQLITTSNLDVAALLTSKSAGYGILPTRVANKFKNLEALENGPFFTDEITLIYHQENRDSKVVKMLTERIKKSVY